MMVHSKRGIMDELGIQSTVFHGRSLPNNPVDLLRTFLRVALPPVVDAVGCALFLVALLFGTPSSSSPPAAAVFLPLRSFVMVLRTEIVKV